MNANVLQQIRALLLSALVLGLAACSDSDSDSSSGSQLITKTTTLSGAQENPANASTATGRGAVIVTGRSPGRGGSAGH